MKGFKLRHDFRIMYYSFINMSVRVRKNGTQNIQNIESGNHEYTKCGYRKCGNK